MTVEKILMNFLEQLISFVGFVFLVGFVISLLNRAFYSLTGTKRWVVYATGFIGTPIHELSHAAMCIVFGHKINEIKLFQIGSEDGTLGYVTHSSNPKNIYHRIGQYFIGVAPIFIGSVVLYFAMMYFLPETHNEINLTFSKLNASASGFAWFENFGDAFVGVMQSILDEFPTSILGWVFIILSMCIALHMNLSRADLKGAVGAVPLLAIVLLAVNFILGFASKSLYADFLGVMASAGIFVALMLSLSLILSLFCVAVALAPRAVLSIVKR